MANGVIATTGSFISMNGTVLCMAEWEVEFDPNLVDATTFCDGGFSDRIATVKDAHFSVKGFWNVLTPPHVSPPDITAGAVGANLLLGVTSGPADQYTFPVYIVDKVRVVAVVRDALKLDFDGYNKGSWTYA